MDIIIFAVSIALSIVLLSFRFRILAVPGSMLLLSTAVNGYTSGITYSSFANEVCTKIYSYNASVLNSTVDVCTRTPILNVVSDAIAKPLFVILFFVSLLLVWESVSPFLTQRFGK